MFSTDDPKNAAQLRALLAEIDSADAMIALVRSGGDREAVEHCRQDAVYAYQPATRRKREAEMGMPR